MRRAAAAQPRPTSAPVRLRGPTARGTTEAGRAPARAAATGGAARPVAVDRSATRAGRAGAGVGVAVEAEAAGAARAAVRQEAAQTRTRTAAHSRTPAAPAPSTAGS